MRERMYEFMVLTNNDLTSIVTGHIREHETALVHAQARYIASEDPADQAKIQSELATLKRLREHYFAAPTPPVDEGTDGETPSTGTSED